MTTSLQDALSARNYTDRLNKNTQSSIELKRNINTSNNSIELPEEIDALIDNKMYRRRYLKLIRDGHLEALRFLAAYATTSHAVDKPSRWFAKVCSVARWDGTLEWVVKQLDVARKAALVAAKLGMEVSNFIYKQIWKGVNVERWADHAREIGRNRVKLFAWLCTHETELNMYTHVVY